METVRLGRTGLVVSRNGFGALPIQRIGMQEAIELLHAAYAGGIGFYDTARFYTDSEEKLGAAFSEMRDRIVIASKTMATTPKDFWTDLETSLSLLKTDYIDIYQFHNPSWCPRSGDGTGMYEAMQEARRRGLIRYIGFTNHRLPLAEEAVRSGLYDTLQFPFSYLASAEEEALVRLCAELDVGFICMKALAGGLITRADAAYAYLASFPNTAPIWGIQRQGELEEFLNFQENPPHMDAALRAFIENERRELAGNFCRGCGYCMPCPVGIEINNCARMSLLLRRSPAALQLTPAVQEKMKRIESCLDCGQCTSRCPYGLDTPTLLRRNYADYQTFL